jgi:hypothetical protein
MFVVYFSCSAFTFERASVSRPISLRRACSGSEETHGEQHELRGAGFSVPGTSFGMN